MKTNVYRVLLVEDDVRQATLLLKLLSQESGDKFEIIHASSLERAKSIISADAVDVVVLDLNLPDSIGIKTFHVLHELKPETPIVILSGDADEDTVIQSLKTGAQDYLVKGQDNGRVIARTLQYAVERTRAELEVRRLQALVYQERRMESLGILAGGIAHEINTPTQFVSSNLEFLSKAFTTLHEVLSKTEAYFDAKTAATVKQALENEISAALKEDRYQYFMHEMKQTIIESADGMDRIRNIVRSMKTFMRNGKREFVAYDVSRIIRDAVNLSRNEWKYVANLNLELADNLPLCSCCPQELCQAFLNIIINAVHAISVKNHGAGPTVELGDISINSSLAGDNIEVRIADTGGGMPDEVKEHMFEPFFTTKETGDGTGLGLSLVYNIIKKHGGRIWYDSRLNQGTVFTIALPLITVDPEHSVIHAA